MHNACNEGFLLMRTTNWPTSALIKIVEMVGMLPVSSSYIATDCATCARGMCSTELYLGNFTPQIVKIFEDIWYLGELE
jgi:hypothetical protein